MQAVRDGRFKLFVRREGAEPAELYDLAADPGESVDVAAGHPGAVERLRRVAEAHAAELSPGGPGCRPVGRVADARPLTRFDPTHPYFAAEYDLSERG